MRGIVALAAAAGCTEYDFVPKVDDPRPEGDTWTPPEDPPDTEAAVDTADCSAFAAPDPYAVAQNEDCLAEPAVGAFSPVVEWQWASNATHPGYDDIMSTPAVGNLTDDNGDGLVDTGDVPDIVFTAFSGGAYTSAGVVVSISGDGSGQHWSVASAGGYGIYSSSGVAIGDLEGDGLPDVCVSGTSTSVVCLEGDGTLKWAAGTEVSYVGCPAIADMDGDGLAEVIFGRQIFDYRGVRIGLGAYGTGYINASFAVDMDADGELEVVAGNAVYEADGTTVWYDGDSDGIPAVGDFDGDSLPEVVRTSSGSVILADTDGARMWRSSIPGGGTGGPPTVADFDGDGEIEVGVAGLAYYTVFETDGSVRWSRPVSDYSSSVTGSSVFDFEGDGAAEVVYADEHTLWVFSGADGTVLMEQTGHASGTLYEYPLIADVDNDDSTEIVVASNNYAWGGWNGITVIGDADSSWAPARPIWNQFAYHITNVESDGGIPATQTENWLSWNNFRAGGTELGPGHWLADLAPGEPGVCLDDCDTGQVSVYLPVENGGLVPATEFEVRFYQEVGGVRTLVRTETVAALDEATSQVLGPFTITYSEWGSGTLVAEVDDPDAVSECDESDNARDLGAWPCG